MDPEFLTYKRFDDIALAEELASHLDNHEIAYFIEEEVFRFDPSLVLSNATTEYAVKVKSADFEKVNKLLKDDETESVVDIGADYYLFSFSDDELMGVIINEDEWSPFDVVLARQILVERGKDLGEAEIEAIKKARIEALRKPEPSQSAWISLGYAAAFLGGVLGIFIGWHLYNYKKTLPNGERVYGYIEKDRRDGKRIFYLSIVIFIVALAYRIYNS